MPLFHTDVKGRCHGIAPVFLPTRTDHTRVGIVNLTADTLIPEILLDNLLRKINVLAERKSSILPI
jgi:hypothetical protein